MISVKNWNVNGTGNCRAFCNTKEKFCSPSLLVTLKKEFLENSFLFQLLSTDSVPPAHPPLYMSTSFCYSFMTNLLPVQGFHDCLRLQLLTLNPGASDSWLSVISSHTPSLSIRPFSRTTYRTQKACISH